jgi:hypothetical protein
MPEPVDTLPVEYEEDVPMGSADLAGLAVPDSSLERVMQKFSRAVSSKTHVIFLAGLGVYLVVLPLFGFVVSAKAELIGGNYTNVTSDIGASIAAGGTLHVIRQGRYRRRQDDERLRLISEMHRLLHHVHARAAAELGQLPDA